MCNRSTKNPLIGVWVQTDPKDWPTGVMVTGSFGAAAQETPLEDVPAAELATAMHRDLKAAGIGTEWGIGESEIAGEIDQRFHGVRIMMVDNETDLIGIVYPTLFAKTGGLTSAFNHTGQSKQEIVNALARNQPDIIIMDYSLLQGLKGTAVLESFLQQHPELLRNSRIILLSGEDRDVETFGAAKHALDVLLEQQGIAPTLVVGKPFSFNRLIDILANLVEEIHPKATTD